MRPSENPFNPLALFGTASGLAPAVVRCDNVQVHRIALASIVLLSGCPDDEPCFDPIQRLEIEGGIPGERWRTGDVDGDGREDLVGMEETQAGVWRLYPFLGSIDAPPFEIAPTVDIDTGMSLTGATTRLLDANGDGVIDIAAFHDGSIVIVDGPLLDGASIRPYSVAELSAGRGEFIDFDDDGIIDFIMREGFGDNLVSLRGLPEGGFEEANTAEFDEGTWCINRFVTYEAGDADWVGAEATRSCGASVDTPVRISLFSIEADGAFAEVASTEWQIELFDSGITLRAAGNFLGDAQPELYINSSIRGAQGGVLEELDSTPDGLRGDFNGDGIIDHAYERRDGTLIEYDLGGEVSVDPSLRLYWDVSSPADLLTALDVDGDGADEMLALQGDAIVVGGAVADCR